MENENSMDREFSLLLKSFLLVLILYFVISIIIYPIFLVWVYLYMLASPATIVFTFLIYVAIRQ